jgi:hypothetical protein
MAGEETGRVESGGVESGGEETDGESFGMKAKRHRAGYYL